MKKDSQNKAILKHLLRGNSITALQAFITIGTLRLSARIYDLRKQGHLIMKDMIKVNDTHVANYYM